MPTTSAPHPYLPESGDSRFSVAHTRLAIDYTPRTNRLEGRAELDVRVLEETKDLRFDLVGLSANKVRVDGKVHKQLKRAKNSLSVRFNSALQPGTSLTVVIEYVGSLRRSRPTGARSAGRNSPTVRSSPRSPAVPPPGSPATTASTTAAPTRSTSPATRSSSSRSPVCPVG